MSRVRPKRAGCVGGGYPKSPGKISWTALYATYRYQAKQRKLAFKISLEYFIKVSSMACHYCGLPPQYHNYYDTQPRRRALVSPETRALATIYKSGLDRVKNGKGYLPLNIIACCRQCNWAKGTLSYLEFFEWIARFRRNT